MSLTIGIKKDRKEMKEKVEEIYNDYEYRRSHEHIYNDKDNFNALIKQYDLNIKNKAILGKTYEEFYTKKINNVKKQADKLYEKIINEYNEYKTKQNNSQQKNVDKAKEVKEEKPCIKFRNELNDPNAEAILLQLLKNELGGESEEEIKEMLDIEGNFKDWFIETYIKNKNSKGCADYMKKFVDIKKTQEKLEKPKNACDSLKDELRKDIKNCYPFAKKISGWNDNILKIMIGSPNNDSAACDFVIKNFIKGDYCDNSKKIFDKMVEEANQDDEIVLGGKKSRKTRRVKKVVKRKTRRVKKAKKVVKRKTRKTRRVKRG